MTMGYNIRANGIRQHLIRHPGPGKQMLLVPGITSPAITWGFVADRLAEKFDVHVLDVRGRGLSETGDLDYTLDAMADDVIAVAQTMDLPIVMGHSMGARIAIRANTRNATVFSGYLLVDPPVSGPMRRPYPPQWPWYGESIRMAALGCSADNMRAYCPTWTEEQVALRAEWLHTCHWGAIRTAFDGFHTDDIHQDIPDIRLPTRLIIAGDAPVIQDQDKAEIATLNPAIDQRVVTSAGHMIPWDNLDGFLAAVMDFDV
ncbi:MAG: alpha/beta hydrolase [Loktanella sp.]|nr:alpha/beta hydrolase [Loktanella sp.]